MNKLGIQQRVLQNGAPLDLDKFEWNEEARVFSTIQSGLVLHFNNISGITFKTGSRCTFTTGAYCIFTTGSRCTFTTGPYCTFKTGVDCTFTTGWDCTFTTDSRCTFTTGSRCTFTIDSYCVIVRRDILQVIQPKAGELIQLCPHEIKGYLVNGLLDEIPHIIADGILSKIVSKKGNIFKVINHGSSKQSYLIENNGNYSHGATLKEAREDLIYKISNRDTSKFKDSTLESILKKDEAIEMYMTITGACEEGTKYFVDSNKLKTKYSVKEIIDLTKGQFGNETFKQFFNK